MSASPTAHKACVVDSPLGPLGVVWSDAGFTRLFLPGRDGARAPILEMLAHVDADLVGVPTRGRHARYLRRLSAHLDGARDDLKDLPVDLRGVTPFRRDVYQTLRNVGPGSTITYGVLGRRCGRPTHARAIGQAMATNPLPLIVPCHRVLAKDGLGAFSAPGGMQTKLRMLTVEGVALEPFFSLAERVLARRDPNLARVIRLAGPCTLSRPHRGDRFTALASAIVHQQVSMKAGATIVSRLIEAYGHRRKLSVDAILSAPAARLRAVGLSRQKASYIRDLAERVSDERLRLNRLDRLDDRRVIEALTAVKGIGRWTAQMFLMFRLGRLDVLPVDDLGVQAGVVRLYKLEQRPGRKELEQLAEAWIPFRSVACWYIWRSLGAGGL